MPISRTVANRKHASGISIPELTDGYFISPGASPVNPISG
jgi:hypothetical protein